LGHLTAAHPLDLILNLKRAAALGIIVPPSILSQAGEVIE
jgi:hypothetical protein